MKDGSFRLWFTLEKVIHNSEERFWIRTFNNGILIIFFFSFALAIIYFTLRRWYLKMSLWIGSSVWFYLRSAFPRIRKYCLMWFFLVMSGACLLIMSVIDDVNVSIRPFRSGEVSIKQAARSFLNKMLLILVNLLNVAILLGGCFWMSKSQCIAAWSDMYDDVYTEWRNVDLCGVITRFNVWPLVCVAQSHAEGNWD